MIAWDSPSDAVGGTAGHVRGLSQSMARLGHDVVILSTGRTTSEIEGVRVLSANVDLPWLPEDDLIARTASANHHITSLVGALGQWTPEVVHAHDWTSSWSALSLASVYRVPLVATFHSTEGSRHGGVVPAGRSSSVHAIESWLALSATRVICTSRFMARETTDVFELLPEHVDLVPNGIDVGQWLVADVPRRDPSVLAWGRVQYEKGFQILAQAMAIVRSSLPGVTCTIAGRGPYLPELQSQIDVEGVSDIVHLAGYVPDEQLRGLLQTSGCVVIPSLYEPFGIVALEALAAGAPTIVARTGGLSEIVEGTAAGLMFEPGNSQELAERILQILTDDDLALALHSQGTRLVQFQYSWDAVADKTLAVYRRASADFSAR